MTDQTVTITRLGHRGDGIAPGPVFVPRALPGEEVSGTRDGDRLENPRILTPSSDRVRAPCRHYNGCGGCQVMHASDDFVAGWKVDHVRTALAAQGIEATFLPIETSPTHSRRRATFAVRRTKKDVLAGFHARGSDTIVAVPECHILNPGLTDALPLVEELGRQVASRKSEVSVAVTLTDVGLDVVVTGGKPLDGPLRATLGALAGQHGVARLTYGDEPVAQSEPPYLTFGTARVTPPPGAFLQATPQGEAALLAHVATCLEGADHIVDLFAGCGTFALPLAQHASVHAVEGDRAMIAALEAGWRGATGVKQVTTEVRDLFRNPLDPSDLARFDSAVIDPPRAGAEAQIAQLAAARPPRIAHVSCNPTTFARDAATLIKAGYAMGPVQVVDQFRWSTHVELVAGFTLV